MESLPSSPDKIRAKKKFGQHFLADQSAMDAIVASLDIAPEERILEIGPGKGALTERLLRKTGRVTAVEIDSECAALLRGRFPDNPALQIVESDFLKLDLPGLLGKDRWKVVGNLPYNVAAPILFRIFDQVENMELFTFMFQAEVARRIVGAPGTSAFGFLSVAAQLHTVPRMIRNLPPGAFRPPPKVRSAVVVFTPRNPAVFPSGKEARLFLDWVSHCFHQRRKMLFQRVARENDTRKVSEAFGRCGIPLRARPEEIGTEQWIELYKLLHF